MKTHALVSLIVATCALSASAATLVKFTKGVSRFADGDSIPYGGWVHLGFYDNATGKPFGQLYFGTREQMARIAHWDLEKNMK